MNGCAVAFQRHLRDNGIDYIKWDHNPLLPKPDAARTHGTYALLDRLRADFPGVEIESCASGGGRPMRLTGLDPAETYRIDLINRADLHHLSRGTPALKTGPMELSGAYLMGHRITLPWSFPERMWVVAGHKL